MTQKPAAVGSCNMSKWQDEKENRNRRSIARLTRALPGIFPSTVLSRALERPFVPPTPGLQLIPTGGRIQFALIVWPARSLPAAGHHTAGPGGLAKTAKADCQQHSGYRRRPIANAHTLRVRVFVACAASRYIDTGGTLICGTRDEQECHLALRLRHRLAILECAQ